MSGYCAPANSLRTGNAKPRRARAYPRNRNARIHHVRMQTMRGRPTLAVSVREHYRRERFIGQRFVPAQQIKVVFEDIELPERRTRKTVRAMWAGPNVIDD